MYGAEWCPDCILSKNFFIDNGIDFEYIQIDKEENAWAIPIIKELNNGKRKIPTIVINDDIVLIEPKNDELRRALGTS